MNQSVINVPFRTPLTARLGSCIYKTSASTDDYIVFTPSCPSHILGENCARAALYSLANEYIQRGSATKL